MWKTLLYIILLIIVLIWIFIKFIKPFNYWKEKGVIYVKPKFFYGNLSYKKSLHYEIQDLYNVYPKERYVGIYQFTQPLLLLRDPELINKIAVKEFNNFLDRRNFINTDLDQFWAKSICFSKGEKWKNLHATISPAFSSSKTKIIFDLINDTANQLSLYFQKQDNNIIEVDMKDIFSRYTNDVIASAVFGVQCDSLKEQNHDFYLSGRTLSDFTGTNKFKFVLNALYSTIMRFTGLTKTRKTEHFFQSIIEEAIKTRESEGRIHPDMINLLMQARDGILKEELVKETGSARALDLEETKTDLPKPQKEKFTNDDIVAQAVTFFLAGYNTVSTLLCFMAYELAINVEIQDKLYKEINETLKNCHGQITYDDLFGMKYLDMVVLETLRRWPPTPITDRINQKPFIIEPEVPHESPLYLVANTSVIIPIAALHWDPEYFPYPEKFDPERFSDKNKETIIPHTFIPFGIGPRNCIGSRFALMEVKLLFLHLLKHFEIIPTQKTQVPLALKNCFNATSAYNFWIGFKKRLN